VNINLHIERLVLDGISVEPHRRTELKTAVETQLGNLLVSNGIDSDLQSNNNSRVVSGGLITLKNTQPINLGQQIGNVVYSGITK